MATDSGNRPKYTCDLRGKVAFVTGASSGLGAHLARVLAVAGARVVVAARRADRLQETVRAIEAEGGTALAVVLDVTDEGSVIAAFDAAQKRFGAADVLLNNAGTTAGIKALELETSVWDDIIATNLRGAFLVAREFAKRLVAVNTPGSIVNVGSILSERVADSVSAYAASKAGVVHMTRALALEWARYRIRVNAIEPGYIKTELNAAFLESPAGEALQKRIPQRRLGTAEDLEGLVLLLASDASSYMTGSVIAIDGGHLVNTL